MREIAIIMAAGLGKRMLPLTLDKPKPLLPVNGIPLIETVIQGLLDRPVKHIYVVTGYLNEMFNYLPKKYKEVELLYNQEYNIKNNISSIYTACEFLGYDDCFVCEGDLFLKDKSILQNRMSSSCYFGVKFNGYMDDWTFEVEKNRIRHISKGGKDTFKMVGVSYFTSHDAAAVRDGILEAYKQTGHEALFWDEIVDANLDKIQLEIHEIENDQIIEVDTVHEYRELCNMIECNKASQ